MSSQTGFCLKESTKVVETGCPLNTEYHTYYPRCYGTGVEQPLVGGTSTVTGLVGECGVRGGMIGGEYGVGRVGLVEPMYVKSEVYPTGVPRLFPYSYCSQEGLEKVFEQVKGLPVEVASQYLIQQHPVLPIYAHPYRGFTVLNGKQVIQEIKKVEVVEPRPVWCVFSGIGNEWRVMGQELMSVEVFRQSIMKCVEVLRPYGINLMEIIFGRQGVVMGERSFNNFVAITAVQIAIVDYLRHIGVHPEGFIGHSIGEIACAYGDYCLTLEEALLTAYHCGKCIEEVQLPVTCMATVGLCWEECQRRIPTGCVVACHNGLNSVTVCGPKSYVQQFVQELIMEGIYARCEENITVPLHTVYMTPVLGQLRTYLEKVICAPKLRSQRWISTSVPEQKWTTEIARFASPEYFVNMLCSPVLFHQCVRYLPTNACVIECGPYVPLRNIMRQTLTQPIVQLIKCDSLYPLEHFFTQIGRMYTEGVHMETVKVFSPFGREQIAYPVSVTGVNGVLPQIVKCEHITVPTWTTPIETGVYGIEKGVQVPVTYKYNVDLIEDAYLTGHQIDGRILYPTTGYLYLIWKSLAQLKGYKTFEQMPINFENVEFHRCTVLPTTTTSRVVETVVVPKRVEFVVRIVPKTGVFELVEGGNVIVSGRVFVPETVGVVVPQQPLITMTGRKFFEQEEIYRELRMRGYEYQGEFQPILKADVEGTCGELLWTGKWVPFLESMLQMNVFGQKRGLLLPTRIRSIKIDPILHLQTPTLRVVRPETIGLVTGVTGIERPYGVLPVVFDQLTNTTVCGGIEINGLHTIVTPRRQPWTNVERQINGTWGVEGVNFVPYFERPVYDDEYVVVDKVVGKEGEYVPEYGVWNPLVDTTVRQNREFVDFYLGECRRYVQHILRKIEQPTVAIQTIVPTVLPTTLEQQLEGLKIGEQLSSFVRQGQSPVWGQLLEGGKLLQLLIKVANIDSTDGQYLYKIQNIFNERFAYLKAWEEDTVLNFATNKCFYLKNILDTVLENTRIHQLERLVELKQLVQPRLRVLEISPSVSQFLGCKVHNLAKVLPQLAGEIEYHYVQPTFVGGEQLVGGVEPEEYFSELRRQVPFPIRKVEWNLLSRNGQLVTEVPSHLRDYDLVVLNGGLSSLLPVVGGNEFELKKWLQVVLEKVVKPQGFVFVHEFTSNVDLLQQLVRLEQIALRRQPVPVSVSPFYQQKLQSEIEWRKLIEEIGLYPVSVKSDIGLSSLMLYRKPLARQVVLGQNGVVLGEEKVLIDSLDQSTWVQKVKVALLEQQIERVWIVSERLPTVEIVGLINGLRREFGGEKIRCVFVADKQPIVAGRLFPIIGQELITVPKVVEWTQLFDQIRKVDLVMNVFRNGQWGAFRQIVEPTLVERLFTTGRQLPLFYWQQPHFQIPFIRQHLMRVFGQLPVVPFEHEYPVEYPIEYPVSYGKYVPYYGQYPTGQFVVSQPRSLVEYVLGVLGVKDLKTVVCNEKLCLGELGLDSVKCIEIKKIFETVYNLPFTPKEIQEMTIEKIRSIELCQQPTRILPTLPFLPVSGVYPTGVTGLTTGVTGVYPTINGVTGVYPTGVTGVTGLTGLTTGVTGVMPRMYTTRKVNYLMPTRVIERLNQIEMSPQQVPVVVIHPIEGHVNMLRSWAKQMKYPVFGVQFTQEAMQYESVEQLAEFYWTQIEKEILRQSASSGVVVVPRIHLCGYSFGSPVAFEMAAKRNGRVASLTFLDGCHSYVNGQLSVFRNRFPMVELVNRIGEVESEILYTFVQQYVPTMITKREFVEELVRLSTLEQRIRYVVRELLTKSQFQFDQFDVELAARSYVNKMLMAIKYQPRQQLVNLPELLLIKSTGPLNLYEQLYGQDYGLGKVFGGKVLVKCVEGDNRSFLEGTNGYQVANILNQHLARYF